MARLISAEAEGDGSAAPYAHYGRPQQREGKHTMDPRQDGTVCPIMFNG